MQFLFVRENFYLQKLISQYYCIYELSFFYIYFRNFAILEIIILHTKKWLNYFNPYFVSKNYTFIIFCKFCECWGTKNLILRNCTSLITVTFTLFQGEADPHAVDVDERAEYGGGARAAPGGPGQPGPGAAPAAEGLGPALHVQPEDGTECWPAPALPAGIAAR